jgi:hypothetical protein
MITRTLLLTIVLVGSFASFAQAVSFDPSKATLECSISENESLYLFQSDREVWLSIPDPRPIQLDLSKFEVYRCPNCFQFSGTADGVLYDGATHGSFNENRELVTILNLKIDGVQQSEISCAKPTPN